MGLPKNVFVGEGKKNVADLENMKNRLTRKCLPPQKICSFEKEANRNKETNKALKNGLTPKDPYFHIRYIFRPPCIFASVPL